jgi:hypothetical protein
VADGHTDDPDIEMYPTRVLAVSALREFGGAPLRSGAEH